MTSRTPRRGQIWWADLGEPAGSAPGFKRPVLIVQSDAFNRSRINTVIAVTLTTNLNLAAAPGNVLVAADHTGLPRDSVVNVSQLITLDRDDLLEPGGALNPELMALVDAGLKRVLALGER